MDSFLIRMWCIGSGRLSLVVREILAPKSLERNISTSESVSQQSQTVILRFGIGSGAYLALMLGSILK